MVVTKKRKMSLLRMNMRDTVSSELPLRSRSDYSLQNALFSSQYSSFVFVPQAVIYVRLQTFLHVDKHLLIYLANFATTTHFLGLGHYREQRTTRQNQLVGGVAGIEWGWERDSESE